MNPPTLQSSLLRGIPGIEHGFGEIASPIPAGLKARWLEAKPEWKQVHGTDCAEVLKAGQACGQVDALWTRTPGVFAGVVTADCVPILLAARDGSAVAAIHAGWRGTLARIVPKVCRQLPRYEWVAAIGPSIRSCCFEVGEDVQAEFIREFRSEFRGRETEINPRHRHLDLARLNQKLLLEAGVSEVEVLDHCTRCGVLPDGTPRFHSYRREKGGTRQYSLIASA